MKRVALARPETRDLTDMRLLPLTMNVTLNSVSCGRLVSTHPLSPLLASRAAAARVSAHFFASIASLPAVVTTASNSGDGASASSLGIIAAAIFAEQKRTPSASF